MAKNKVNNGLFGVNDLAENAQKNVEERNTTHIHNTHTQCRRKKNAINVYRSL